MINVVRRRGLTESFDSGQNSLEWTVIVTGYNFEEKKDLINEVSDNIIKMTPRK